MYIVGRCMPALVIAPLLRAGGGAWGTPLGPRAECRVQHIRLTQNMESRHGLYRAEISPNVWNTVNLRNFAVEPRTSGRTGGAAHPIIAIYMYLLGTYVYYQQRSSIPRAAEPRNEAPKSHNSSPRSMVYPASRLGFNIYGLGSSPVADCYSEIPLSPVVRTKICMTSPYQTLCHSLSLATSNQTHYSWQKERETFSGGADMCNQTPHS